MEEFVIENNILEEYNEQPGKTEVIIPDGIKGIGSAFYDCKNLKSVIMPNSVTFMGKDTFRNSSLEKVIFSKKLKYINERDFANCKNLTSIDIPDSVENIYKYAFSDCTNLTSVTFGKGLKEIDNYVFYGCVNIKIVNVSSYEVFELLGGRFQTLALNTIIKNNQKFNEEDSNKFKEYLIKNKMRICGFILLYGDMFYLLNYILDNKMLTKKELDELLDEAIEMDLNKTNPEVFEMLMNYKHDNFLLDSEHQILNMLDKFNLDDDILSDDTYEDKNDEEKGKTK